MLISEYKVKAKIFAKYDNNPLYPLMGLQGELGEVAGKLAKEIRDKEDLTEALKQELGDCCWMVASVAEDNGLELDEATSSKATNELWEITLALSTASGLVMDMLIKQQHSIRVRLQDILNNINSIALARGVTLAEVMQLNVDKLTSRRARNCIGGSGDNR